MAHVTHNQCPESVEGCLGTDWGVARGPPGTTREAVTSPIENTRVMSGKSFRARKEKQRVTLTFDCILWLIEAPRAVLLIRTEAAELSIEM